MTAWSTLTWDVARVGGLVAYLLLAVSVAIGLLLSMGWRSPRWTRFVTNDLHRFVTLLALVFTGIHTLGVWIDPFMAYTPLEVFVPFVSHYRPLWVALGIVSAYLLIALWLSERLRSRVGYAWWRRFHGLSFVAYVAVTIHSIGTGSDTRTWWAILCYFGSAAVITALTVARLVPTDLRRPSHPFLAGGGIVLAVAVAGWTVLGPLQPGWNAIANDGHGSGESVALAASAGAPGAPGAATGATPTPPPTLGSPFEADFQGVLRQSAQGSDGLASLVISGTLSGGLDGSLQIGVRGQTSGDGAFAVSSTSLSLTTPDGGMCTGQITDIQGGQMAASCTTGAGQSVELGLRLRIRESGSVGGVVTGAPQ